MEILKDSCQLIHYRITSPFLASPFLASFIYAKCSRTERLELWDSLRDIASSQVPWMIGGDFNTITLSSEREGGLAPDLTSMTDFNSCIQDCNMMDIGFTGHPFTWHGVGIYQRLDRSIFNQSWIEAFPQLSVTHGLRKCSDHRPLFITGFTTSTKPKFQFMFQSMWLLQSDFQNVVQQNWESPTFQPTGMRKLAEKIKRLKQRLGWWNRNVFGNLFSSLAKKEAEVHLADRELQQNHNTSNLEKYQKVASEFDTLLEMEEHFWKQKARSKWTLDGDKNTKLYHSMVQRKKSRLKIHSIEVNNT